MKCTSSRLRLDKIDQFLLIQTRVSDVCPCVSAGPGWVECPSDKPPSLHPHHEMHQQQIPPRQHQTVDADKSSEASSGGAQAIYAVLCQMANHWKPCQYVATRPTGELKELMNTMFQLNLSRSPSECLQPTHSPCNDSSVQSSVGIHLSNLACPGNPAQSCSSLIASLIVCTYLQPKQVAGKRLCRLDQVSILQRHSCAYWWLAS